MILILIGPPGSGKGTQAEILSNCFAMKHIATGDILRELAKKDLTIAQTIQSGNLLPAQVVNQAASDAIRTYLANQDNIILDGYPRSIEQAEYLEKEFGDQKFIILCLEIAYDELVKRILGRFTCSKCAKIYNKYCNNPANGVCEVCGSQQFSTRSDDTEETIHKRIAEYEKQTLPLINFYKEKRKDSIYYINSNQSIEDTKSMIKNLLTRI